LRYDLNLNQKEFTKATDVDNWNLNEIAAASTILSTYHSICALVLGIGIIEEVCLNGLKY
jgi:hypothetical protein